MRKLSIRMTLFCLSLFCVFAQAETDNLPVLKIDQGVNGWTGIKGESKIAPKISLLPEGVAGAKAVKAQAVSTGEWQGISLKLDTPVDLKKYRSITFWIKQGYSPVDTPCVLMLKAATPTQEQVNYPFKSGVGQWTKVEIPLDPYSWNQAENVKKAEFATIGELLWYPYSAMHRPGQFMAIAGVRFNPKIEKSQKIPVMEYHYLDAVDNGDANRRILTDSLIARDKQAHWRMYTNNPDISFDLGGIYLIKDIKIDAFGVPARNISDVVISVSTDKEEWKPVETIVNTDTGGAEQHQVLQKSGMNIIGRYVRLQINRPRTDVPVFLSEVTFSGKLPTDEEFSAAAWSNYGIGPVMPKVSAADYWIIKKGNLSFAVNRNNGIICNLSVSGKTIAERIFDRYQLLNKTKLLQGDGYSDKVVSSRQNDGGLCIRVTNAQIPGLQLEKTFQIVDGLLDEKIKLIDNKTLAPGIVSLSTEVVLNKDYRNGGIYENWGGDTANILERESASDIAFNMGVSNNCALSFENVPAGNTILHYLYSRNDKFTPLGWTARDLSGAKSLSYTPTGWRMGLGAFEIGDGNQTAESHLAVSEGMLLKAYDTYRNLPKVKEFYDSLNRPKWLGDLRCVIAAGSWEGMWPKNSELGLSCYPLLLRDGYFLGFSHGDYCWGEFPTEGTVRADFGMKFTAEELKARIARWKKTYPQLKVLLYSWLWSASDSSDVFKKHPNWFVPKDKNGYEKIFYPYFGKNYYRFASIKESQDAMFNDMHRVINFYGSDGWYLDGGAAEGLVDEWNFRFDEPNGWYDLQRRLRTQLQKEDPERILFFNNAVNPLCDLGFLESTSILASSSWRLGAAWMWKFKLYQYRDQLRSAIYIYWTPAVEGNCESYIAGLGILPGFNSRDIYQRDVAYLTAQHEMRLVELADAGLAPDWRYDKKTTLEAITLKMGNAGFVFMRSHAKNDVGQTVGVNAAGLGMTDKSKPVYQWLFRVQDARKWKAMLGEPELEKIYRNTNWRLERIAAPEFLGESELSELFSRTFALKPEQLGMWMITQSPAMVYSVNGLPSQYWLPETLGIKISGTITDKQIALDVDCGQKTAEIITAVPQGYYPQSVSSDKTADIPCKKVLVGDNLFVILPAMAGRQKITVNLAKADLPEGLPEFTYTPGVPGKEMTLEIKLDASWIGKPVLVHIENNGILNWCESTIASSTEVQMKTLIPQAVAEGDYTIVVSDCSGRKMKKAVFKLPQGHAQTQLPARYVTLTTESNICDVPAANRGTIPVGRYAMEYSKDTCNVTIEPKSAKIFVATAPVIDSLWNVSAGGLEFKAKRYLKLRLGGNLAYFKRHGHFYGGHSIYSSEVNHFIGLLFDFRSREGYRVRTAASLGAVNVGRTSELPDKWGTCKKADNIFYLSNFAYDDKDSMELWVDLKQFGAPEDWDGMIWLTAILQLVNPDRQMTVEVLETSDKLPAGAVMTVGKDLLGVTNAKKQYDVPAIDVPIVVDGNINENVWKKAVKISGLTIVNNPGNSMPQPTSCYALHDKKNLYLCFEVKEDDANSFVVRSSENPWENDSVEFCMKMNDKPEKYLHAVIDSAGLACTFIGLDAGAERIAFPGKVAVTKTKGIFFVEMSIPLEKLQVKPGDKIRFNIMRNRFARGESQYGTLVPGNSYFNTERYYDLILD